MTLTVDSRSSTWMGAIIEPESLEFRFACFFRSEVFVSKKDAPPILNCLGSFGPLIIRSPLRPQSSLRVCRTISFCYGNIRPIRSPAVCLSERYFTVVTVIYGDSGKTACSLHVVAVGYVVQPNNSCG